MSSSKESRSRFLTDCGPDNNLESRLSSRQPFLKACEAPRDSNRPIAKLTQRELSLQLKLEGLLESISGRWVGELLVGTAIRPHKNK